MKYWYVIAIGLTSLSAGACSSKSNSATGSQSADHGLDLGPAGGSFHVSWDGDARTADWKSGGANLEAKEEYMGSPSHLGIWASGVNEAGQGESVGFQVLHQRDFPRVPLEGTYDVSSNAEAPHQVAIFWNEESASSGTITLTQDANRVVKGSFVAQFSTAQVGAEFEVKYDSLFCLIAPDDQQPIGESPDGKPLSAMQIDEQQTSTFCHQAKSLVGL
jgi:hypothetical protein